MLMEPEHGGVGSMFPTDLLHAPAELHLFGVRRVSSREASLPGAVKRNSPQLLRSGCELLGCLGSLRLGCLDEDGVPSSRSRRIAGPRPPPKNGTQLFSCARSFSRCARPLSMPRTSAATDGTICCVEHRLPGISPPTTSHATRGTLTRTGPKNGGPDTVFLHSVGGVV
jgi:hypothetical protein